MARLWVFWSLLCFAGQHVAAQATTTSSVSSLSTSTTSASTATISRLACASPGVGYQLNSNNNLPGSVNYTIECGSDTSGTGLDPPPNQYQTTGFMDCLGLCESRVNCSAFTYRVSTYNSTGYPDAVGTCYLKQLTCAQGVDFTQVGQNDAGRIAGLRPYPVAPNSTTTVSSSAAATATNDCAARPSPVTSPNHVQYYVQCDIDTDGSLLTVVPGITNYASCLTNCDTTTGCIGYTYKEFNNGNCPGYCYLKSNNPGNGTAHFTPNTEIANRLVSVLRLGPYTPGNDTAPATGPTNTVTPTPGSTPPPSSASPVPGSCYTSISSPASGQQAAGTCSSDNGTTVLDASGQPYYVACQRSIGGATLGTVDNQGISYTNCMNLCTTNNFVRTTAGDTTPCYGVTLVPSTLGGRCYFKSFTTRQIQPLGTSDAGAVSVIRPEWLAGYPCALSSSSSSVSLILATSSTITISSTSSSSVVVPSSSPSSLPPDCPAANGAYTINGVQWAVQCGSDLYGVGVTPPSQASTTYQGCFALCDSTANCGGFSYNAGNCYFKQAYAGGFLFSGTAIVAAYRLPIVVTTTRTTTSSSSQIFSTTIASSSSSSFAFFSTTITSTSTSIQQPDIPLPSLFSTTVTSSSSSSVPIFSTTITSSSSSSPIFSTTRTSTSSSIQQPDVPLPPLFGTTATSSSSSVPVFTTTVTSSSSSIPIFSTTATTTTTTTSTLSSPSLSSLPPPSSSISSSLSSSRVSSSSSVPLFSTTVTTTTTTTSISSSSSLSSLSPSSSSISSSPVFGTTITSSSSNPVFSTTATTTTITLTSPSSSLPLSPSPTSSSVSSSISSSVSSSTIASSSSSNVPVFSTTVTTTTTSLSSSSSSPLVMIPSSSSASIASSISSNFFFSTTVTTTTTTTPLPSSSASSSVGFSTTITTTTTTASPSVSPSSSALSSSSSLSPPFSTTILSSSAISSMVGTSTSSTVSSASSTACPYASDDFTALDGSGWTVRCGSDIYGQDLAPVYASNGYMDCFNICDTTDGCSAFTFEGATSGYGFCNLKTAYAGQAIDFVPGTSDLAAIRIRPVAGVSSSSALASSSVLLTSTNLPSVVVTTSTSLSSSAAVVTSTSLAVPASSSISLSVSTSSPLPSTSSSATPASPSGYPTPQSSTPLSSSMQSSTAQLPGSSTASSTSSTYIPTVSQVPTCAQACVDDLGGCAMGDVKCICSNTAYLTRVAACVSQRCPPTPCQQCIDFGTTVCNNVGVYNLPQPSCAASTSGSSSSAPATSSSTYIPTVSQVPTCAQACVDDLGGCAMGDVKCICSNTAYLTRVATCVSQRCPPVSCQQCIDFGTMVCNNVGVYNLPQPSCAASSSVSGQVTMTVTPLPAGTVTSKKSTSLSTGTCVKRTTVIPVYSREL